MKIDKSSEIDLAEYAINPACARDGIIYYNGTQTSHYLYTLNTANDRIAELWAGNIWYPAIDGDYIYYLDVENNYRLCRYVLSENIIQVVTQERVDCFNVGNGYIYYQVSSDTSPALKMMATDGSGALTLAEGNYTHINMTSQYVYFQKFGEDAVMYHSPIGSAVYSQM